MLTKRKIEAQVHQINLVISNLVGMKEVIYTNIFGIISAFLFLSLFSYLLGTKCFNFIGSHARQI